MKELTLREKEQAATPGPWRAGGCAIEGPFTPTGRERIGVVCEVQGISTQQARNNATFIAAARNALPEFIRLLGEAVCPDCENSGGVPNLDHPFWQQALLEGEPPDDSWLPCQWCTRVKELLGETG